MCGKLLWKVGLRCAGLAMDSLLLMNQGLKGHLWCHLCATGCYGDGELQREQPSDDSTISWRRWMNEFWNGAGEFFLLFTAFDVHQLLGSPRQLQSPSCRRECVPQRSAGCGTAVEFLRQFLLPWICCERCLISIRNNWASALYLCKPDVPFHTSLLDNFSISRAVTHLDLGLLFCQYIWMTALECWIHQISLQAEL